MAKDIHTAKSKDGKSYDFVVKADPPSGAMKYVYFSPNKDYVVGFFKEPQDARAMARLESITEKYRHDIFEQVGGDYWKDLFCWPEKIVEWEGKTGIIVPTYAKHFFFQHDKRLKLGITPKLHIVSQFILIILMYLGRVGGLTLIYAVPSKKKKGNGLRQQNLSEILSNRKEAIF